MSAAPFATPDAAQALASMNDLTGEAWSSAMAGWEHAVAQTAVGSVMLACAYALMALLALAAARRSRRPARWDRRWLIGAVVLTALAGMTLLRLDLLAVLFLRSLARSEGWYAQRRTWQGLAAALLLVPGLWWMQRGSLVSPGLRPSRWPRLRSGLGLLTLIAGLRLVSWHQTDELLAWSLGLASLGRLAEAGGLVLVALAVWPALRAR